MDGLGEGGRWLLKKGEGYCRRDRLRSRDGVAMALIEANVGFALAPGEKLEPCRACAARFDRLQQL